MQRKMQLLGYEVNGRRVVYGGLRLLGTGVQKAIYGPVVLL